MKLLISSMVVMGKNLISIIKTVRKNRVNAAFARMEPFLRTKVRLSSLSKYLNRPANSHDFAISLTKFIFSRGITIAPLMSRF